MNAPLVTALRDPDVRVRVAAAGGLRDLRGEGPAMSPVVRPALESDRLTDPRASCHRDRRLLSSGDSFPAHVLSTRRALADPDSNVRLATVRALERSGPAAEQAIPDLARALKDSSAVVRTGAAVAIGAIGPEKATQALREALRDRDAEVRREAEHALGGFHRPGGEAPGPPEPGHRGP